MPNLIATGTSKGSAKAATHPTVRNVKATGKLADAQYMQISDYYITTDGVSYYKGRSVVCLNSDADDGSDVEPLQTAITASLPPVPVGFSRQTASALPHSGGWPYISVSWTDVQSLCPGTSAGSARAVAVGTQA